MEVVSQALENLATNNTVQILPTVLGFLIILYTVYWISISIYSGKINFEKAEIITLVIILASSFFLNIGQPYMTGAGGGEEYNYVLIGEEISESGRFTVSRSDHNDLYLKPYIIYPVLVSIPSFFLDTTRNLGVMVNTVAAIFLLFFLYLSIRKISNKKAALAATVLTIFNPLFVHMSRTPESMITAGTYFFLTVFTLQGFLKNEDRFWMRGLTVSVLGMIFSRTGMFIFVPLIIMLIIIKKVEMKRFLTESLIFVLFGSVPFLMNLRFFLNMDRAFGGGTLIMNIQNFFDFLHQKPGYITLLVIAFPSLLIAIKNRKTIFLYLAGLTHFLFFLTYRHASILNHPKFYMLSFVIFSCVAGIGFSEIGNKLKPKNTYIPVLVGVVLVSASTGLMLEQLNRDRYYTPAKRTLDISTSLHPDCVIIPRDVRHARLAGFQNSIDPWFFTPEELGNPDLLKEETGSNCIIYYRNMSETPEHMELFEKSFEKELITSYEHEGSEAQAFHIDLNNN